MFSRPVKYLSRKISTHPNRKYDYIYRPTTLEGTTVFKNENLETQYELLNTEPSRALEQIHFIETKPSFQQKANYATKHLINLIKKDKKIIDVINLPSEEYYKYRKAVTNKEFANLLDNYRFISKHKVQLGNFDDLVPQKKYLETLLDKLPFGMTVNNRELSTIALGEDLSGFDTQYAEYDNEIETITIRNAANDVDSSRLFSFNELDTKFARALYHEIGHAVNYKYVSHLGLHSFNEFASIAGWSVNTDVLKAIMNGDVKKVYRSSDEQLITDYAETNPFECFSEYFSEYLTRSYASVSERLAKGYTEQDLRIFSWLDQNIFQNTTITKSIFMSFGIGDFK